MNLGEALAESVESLRRNRLRSGLTMLGIVWGLVTVVLLLSYGGAIGTAVMEGFMGFGHNVIMIWGGQTSMQAGGQRSGQKIKLKDGDMEAVRDSLPFLSAISRETDDSFSVKYGPKVVLIQSKAVDLPYPCTVSAGELCPDFSSRYRGSRCRLCDDLSCPPDAALFRNVQDGKP